jgi:hypothetical protein
MSFLLPPSTSMKRNLTVSILLVLLASVTPQSTRANVPELLSYQGRISTPSGSPVGAGTPVNRLMIFSFFDAPTGGNRVWTEQQYANVFNGEFTVLLGNGTAVPTHTRDPLSNVFAAHGANLYLEVTVDTGDGVISLTNVAADPPISPRQRMVSTGYAFRARSTDSITPGGDLRFISTENPAYTDYGLGLYNSSRQFNNIDVNGPVLFGQGGGGLGSSSSGTQSLALSWLGDGKVGIGVHPPTERLDVSGNIKASGTLELANGITAGGAIAATGNIAGGSLTTTGAITGTALTGKSLSIKPTAAATELAGIGAGGSINLTKGGTLLGPTGNVLNIDSVGRITIKDLTVTGNVILPGGETFGAIQVLAADKRLVLGGATGWGATLAATANPPTAGANATTGMRIILKGTDPASDLVGFGMADANTLYSVAPAATITTWYGGTSAVMTLNNSTRELTARQFKLATTRPVLEAEGSSSARLLLTAGSIDRGLSLTNRSSGTADLKWFKPSDSTEVDIMTFKRTTTDSQLSDTVADLGYVGINVTNPKAPLHVRSPTAYLTDTHQHVWGLNFNGNPPTPYADRPLHGVFLGNGGVATWGDHSNIAGDGDTVLYQYLAAIFDGELLARRMWFGNALDTASDERAKQIKGLTNPATDLSTLMQLKVTDYRWIDRSLDQHRPHKRLIAQEVKQTFPQAASTAPTTQAIPNVYELATELKHDAAKRELTITTKKAHEFKKDDRVDLISDRKKMKETPVKAVLSAHAFVIDCEQAPESLFVYGKHVNDFHTVDYDAISMLNVSATQQLKTEHDTLAAENKTLREELAQQERDLAALEAAERETTTKLKAIEARIRSGASSSAPAAQTASLPSTVTQP